MRTVEAITANHIAQVKFEDLEPEVIETTKIFLLDTIGVALAGIGAPGCEIILNYILEKNCKPNSTIWGYGLKTSIEHAALINGMLAHALDLDDTYVPGGLHTNAVIVPALIAIAENQKNISGKSFLTALATGVDLACRLSIAARDGLEVGWWPTSLFGIFGSTAAVSKMLNFDTQRIHNALGIAYTRIAGNRQSMLDGSLTKRLQCGYVAQSAVMSCQLADLGINGAENFLFGPYGLVQLYAKGKFNLPFLTKNLGKEFLGTELLCKIFPCCSGAQGPVQAVLELVQDNSINYKDVFEVRVMVPPETAEQLGHSFVLGDSPQAQAQFNLKYLVASALVNKQLTLKEIEDETIRNSFEVFEFSKRVSIIRQDMEFIRNVELPLTVELEMDDGTCFHRTLYHISGEASNPKFRQLCLEKFNACLNYRDSVNLKDWGDKMINSTMQLDAPGVLDSWLKLLTSISIVG